MASTMIIQDGIQYFFDGPDYDDVIKGVFEQYQDEVIEYMRSNASWEDRTGDARAGLDANTVVSDGEVTLSLEHGVEYGFWLETIQSGRFAILLPTVEAYSGRIHDDVVEALLNSHEGRNY